MGILNLFHRLKTPTVGVNGQLVHDNSWYSYYDFNPRPVFKVLALLLDSVLCIILTHAKSSSTNWTPDVLLCNGSVFTWVGYITIGVCVCVRARIVFGKFRCEETVKSPCPSSKLTAEVESKPLKSWNGSYLWESQASGCPGEKKAVVQWAVRTRSPMWH